MRRSTSARSVGFARSTSAIAAGEIPPTYKDCPASATRENFVRRREETGPSEQRDTYRRALLDSVDVCGDLDVSVCVRHRGDRAALLERRDRGLFFFQAEDGIRAKLVTGVQTCALPI